ncbi:S-adenosyl-L-methionine-dependent methyltransferase [Microthyrium microscopicum]|uniref:S-adenosyl-L-methionine-dependent methyltransferase n=1 Tax=Microthyrium microscopicum TaxID=703497 RepID=A0A6A6UKR0_9PEZI|nr:S-adenosyl-L-methionine-dependent methyltransferase [Microthyrium microscopicum]
MASVQETTLAFENTHPSSIPTSRLGSTPEAGSGAENSSVTVQSTKEPISVQTSTATNHDKLNATEYELLVATQSTKAPSYEPYRAFTHAYGKHADSQEAFERPILFSGPKPDTHPDQKDDNDEDSAIEDYSTQRSASVSSSIYEFREEHGRRYHAMNQGAEYHLPNDDLELDRLDLQHALFLLALGNNLHRAPIAPDIQNVLDIGTGTGIWAIDFADKYKSAIVVGTDLSPVQPDFVPPNCRFYVENAEDTWAFETQFDFIHTRMLVVGIKDWPRLFQQSFKALRPGGYIELQDLTFPVRCDDASAPPDSPLMVWGENMIKGAAKVGVNLSASNQFPKMLAEAGFVDIHVETFGWPINKWPKEKTMKRIGMYGNENFLQGLQGFTMAFFARGLGWSVDEIKPFVEKVRAQACDVRSHVYIPVSFFWARKPEGNKLEDTV